MCPLLKHATDMVTELIAENPSVCSHITASEGLNDKRVLQVGVQIFVASRCLFAQEDCPVFSEGVHRHAVLQAAAMAAKWWEPPRDALDAMVLNAAALHELEGYSHTDYMPFDPSIKVGSPLLTAATLEHSTLVPDTPRKPIYLSCWIDRHLHMGATDIL